MTKAISILKGPFGRVALLEMDAPLITHAHHHCHIILNYAGCDQTFGVRDRVYPLTDQTAILVNSWEPHFYVHAPEKPVSTSLALYIEPEWLARVHRTLSASARPDFFPSPCVPLSAEVRRMALELGTLMEFEIAPEQALLEERILDLVLELLYRFSEWRVRPSYRAQGVTDYRIRRAIRDLRENLTAPPDVAGLAQVAGLSRSRFFDLFKQQTGLTPHLYTNELRIEAAIQKLALRDRPVCEVALDLGFDAHANFTRFFRDHAGATPSSFRQALSLYER